MRAHTTTLLLVLGLGALMLGAPHTLAQPVGQPSFQATAVWGSPQSPILAAPGSASLPLYVVVANIGPTQALNVLVTFEASYPLTPVKGVPENLSVRLPVLPAGSSASLLGYYNVSPSVSPGVYNQTVVVEYSVGGQVYNETLKVGVPILGVANIELAGFSYNPIRVYPGYPYAELSVVLVNTGTATASSVSLNLTTSYPVYPAFNGSSHIAVGYMPVGQPVSFTFPLAIYNTSSAVNTTLTLTVSYNGGRTHSFRIPFTEYPKAVLEVVGVSTPTVRVGDSADYVTVTVKNVGDVPAQYLTFTLLPSSVFQLSVPSSENPLLAVSAVNESVGTLMPGQTVNVTYVVEVSSNIQHGTYQLSLLATWRQQGAAEPFTQELTVPITVHRTLVQSYISSLFNPSDPLPLILSIVILVLIVILIAVAVGSRRRGPRAASPQQSPTPP